jgi:putative transposase
MSVKVYGQVRRINVRDRRIEEMGDEGQDWAAQGRLSVIEALIPLGLKAVGEELQQEVRELIGGERHSRTGGTRVRWGSNPGSVYLGDQKLRINVPRVRDQRTRCEIPLQGYLSRQDAIPVDERAYQHVIHGIAQGRYALAAERVAETFGISKSSVSRKFVRASAKRLEQLQSRDLSGYDIVAVFIDGKHFAENEVVIALGVTMEGDKVVLGFVETSTENHQICRDFLNQLKDRGLRLDREVLFVIDGGKGIHKGIREVMGDNALIARCQWHKRENVVSYLAKERQKGFRSRLQEAYNQTSYELAKKSMAAIRLELREINASAATSLDEGLEETLLLQRLGVAELLGQSFRTTNCIENVNRSLERATGRVSRWRNSDQRQRWVAAALLEAEKTLNRVMGYEHLETLRKAMKRVKAGKFVKQ